MASSRPIGHKHGGDVCGNYGDANIDKRCLACIDTQIFDNITLRHNFEKVRLKSFNKFTCKEYENNFKHFAKIGFWVFHNEIVCNFCKITYPNEIVCRNYKDHSDIDQLHECRRKDLFFQNNISIDSEESAKIERNKPDWLILREKKQS